MLRRPLANLLSASTADVPAGAAASPVDRRTRVSFAPWLSDRRFFIGLLVVSLAVGAFSLLIPSTPSYDPWSWLVWGREIIHVNLQTTGGPTWKPLPVVFTTIFAIFGKAQPDLWLVVARAGAFAAVVMVIRLSYRLTRDIGNYFTHAAGQLNGVVARLPGLLAGAIAAVALTLSAGYIVSNALGYSEGLALAAVLIAADRHLCGKPRQAFAVGFLAALDRPEIWAFWGPYGLWLFWKDPGARRLVVGLFVLIPLVWFAPEYWGSGHFLRGVSRAQHVRSNSLALSKCPFCAELKDAAWPTILLRVKVAAIILALVVAFVLGRRWRKSGRRGLLAPTPVRAMGAAALAGVTGLAWFVLIATLTQAGFSGNDRYLIFGSALIEICGAVAFGWATQEFAGLLMLPLRRGERAERAVAAGAGLVATGLGALAFLIVPNWVGQNLINIPRSHHAIVYQAHLREDLGKLVSQYGGPAKLLRCGTVMTEGFQVPMVAWTLGVHTLDVQASPPSGSPPPPAPNVILQTRAQSRSTLLPIVHTWPNVHYTYAGHDRTFRLFTNCRG